MEYKMVSKIKNNTKLVYVLFLILLFGCKDHKINNKTEFYKIEWNSKVKYSDSTKKYYYTESILVNDSPENSALDIADMMLEYRSKYIDMEKNSMSEYILVFYKYDSSSKVYLTKKYRNDLNGVTYRLLDDDKYKIGMLILERCDSIENKWNQYVHIYPYDKRTNTLKYSIDSCVSVVDNQFDRKGKAVTYKPMY